MNFDPATLIARALVLLVAMTVHEFAHAYFAYLNGDPTAKEMGRMSLNPIVNINWMGFAFGVMTGFGFLGSAPIVPQRMRDPRWGTFQAVLAGPISNLVIAAVFAVPLRFGFVTPTLDPGTLVFPTLGYVLTLMVYLNIILFVFNLIPLFPLDGWTIVLAALPAGAAVDWQRYRQVTYYLFFGLIILSFVARGPLAILNVLGYLVQLPSELILRALLGV